MQLEIGDRAQVRNQTSLCNIGDRAQVRNQTSFMQDSLYSKTDLKETQNLFIKTDKRQYFIKLVSL